MVRSAGAVSPVGAQGVAQFMPATANWRGLFNFPIPLIRWKLLPNPQSSCAICVVSLRKYRASQLPLTMLAQDECETGLRVGALLPAETGAYVRIVTGHSPEQWAGVATGIGEIPRKCRCRVVRLPG